MTHTKEQWEVEVDSEGRYDNKGHLLYEVWHDETLIAAEISEANARRIVACVNFCGEVLTDALEESNLEGMYTRGAGDDLKALAVRLRNQRNALRQDKADLLAALQVASTDLEDWLDPEGEFDVSEQGLRDLRKDIDRAIAKGNKV